MTEESWLSADIDLFRPSIARIYDYFLGGKDNFPADREAAERILAVAPHVSVLARQNRAFLGRAVRFLAEAGIRQFLDVGTGLPTQDNVHQVAQRVAPDARVVYVDNDPVACVHARALRTGPTTAATTAVVEADLRRPEDILGHPEVHRLIDFDQPVAVFFLAVLHCISDEDDPAGLVARFRDAMAPGSYLVVSHGLTEEPMEQAVAEWRQAGLTGVTVRSREAILGFFDGLDLVEPGLVSLPGWRPTTAVCDPTWFTSQYQLPIWALCGVGHKP